VYDWTSDFVAADLSVQQRLVGAELSQLIVVAERSVQEDASQNLSLKRQCGLYLGRVRQAAASLQAATMPELSSDVLEPMLDWSSVDDLRRFGPRGALVSSLCEVVLCAVGVYNPELADQLLVINVDGDESSLPKEHPQALLGILTEEPWQIACQVARVDLDVSIRRLSRARMAAMKLMAVGARSAEALAAAYEHVLDPRES